MKTGEPTAGEEYLYGRGDGTMAWMRFDAAPIRNDRGEVVAGVVAIVDIDQEKKAEEALRKSEERLQLALEASTIVGTWDWDIQADIVYADERFASLFGLDPGRAAAGTPVADFVSGIHPDDRERTQKIIQEALASGGSYEAEYRTVDRDGILHWVSARGRCYYVDGTPVRFPGAVVDITERKRWEEHQRLLINELNHRVKNTLATVQSIASQSLRGARSPEEAHAAMEARLFALSRAHDVLTQENWESAALLDIVSEAISPYSSLRSGRLHVSGPDVRLPPQMALAIAMSLQELATNAVKYGALSTDAGDVEISWTIRATAGAPRLNLRWEERRGPPVVMPTRRGFGSRLIERSLALDLGGTASLAFEPTGLICTVDAPIRSLEDEAMAKV